MKTAIEVARQIEQAAERTTPALRTIESMKVSEVVRQGDLYVERIARLPKSRGPKTANRQLAIGETQGSRHVAEGDVTVYATAKDADALTGPVIVARERWTLTHPEHGHFSLPAGKYRTRYQRDYARERAEELRRVQD